MSENNRTSKALTEAWDLLNTIENDECYTRIWSSLPPYCNPQRWLKTFAFVQIIHHAKIVIPDSVLKRVEFYNSAISERLLKIKNLSSSLEEDKKVSECGELCDESFGLGNDVGFLGMALGENVICPALRGHFPPIEETSN